MTGTSGATSAIESIVFRRGDELVGYARVHEAEPGKPRALLARDGETARLVAGALAQRSAPGVADLHLPLHPASPAARAFLPASVQVTEAAMAAPLAPSPLDQYLAEVRAGERAPGRVVWPVEFDL